MNGRAYEQKVGSVTALGSFDVLGKYSMVCALCFRKIPGTISLDLLRQALVYNASRGGIQCPECRETSCPNCGVSGVKERDTDDCISGLKKPGQLCTICTLEKTTSLKGSRHSLSSTNITQNDE